jgi:hypothetical protein
MKKILFLVIIIILFVSCENQSNNSDTETKPEYAQVTFNNNTQFYVQVYRDTTILLFEELAPGESKTSDIQGSVENHIGTTFRYSYRYKLSEKDDIFSGEAFADGLTSGLEETFVIEKGNSYSRDIPVPENISFNYSYVRIKNDVSYNIAFRRINSVLLQLGNKEIMIPTGKTGIYRLGRNELNIGDYTLRNVETPYYFPSILLEPGYIYDFILTNIENTPKIIPDIHVKIKPEPTNTWKKIITNFTDGNFTDSNSNLNKYLTSIHRYGISHWRSNYPVNKLIYNDNTLVSGEWGFGVIPVVIQNTGIAEAYEIPNITAKVTNWENAVFPARIVYAGTTSATYQTAFNDIIRINKNYVILSTYSKSLRTGILLSFLNEQGQIIDSLDIPASSNLESLTGVKLVNVDNNAFLVLGNRKEYTGVNDEHFTTSSSIIFKFQYGNKTEIWTSEYTYSDNPINTSVCGLDANDNYIVCCYTGDNTATRSIILKINKTNGAVTEIQNYGAASESWRPFFIGSDVSGNIYITGIATEGAVSQAYIVKLDTSYNQVWLKKYGNYYDNFLFDLDITDNLLTAVGSANNGSVFDPSFYGWQAGKGWIARIDTETGFVLKETFYDSVSSFNSIVQLNDSGFALAAIKSVDNKKPYWFDTFAVKVNEHLVFGE